MPYRFVPTSFDPHDTTLTALRFNANWQYTSLTDALRSLGAELAILRLPLFWQILSPIHSACKEANCTIFVNERGNMPVGEAAAQFASANTVITDTEDAFTFSLYLNEKNTRIPNWVVVHEPTKRWDLPLSFSDHNVHVWQEVHLFPGVPMLVQCKDLAKNKMPLFHKVEDIGQEFVPPVEFTLTPELVSSGICTCGKEIVGRTTY
jgi:hypothetical protein